MYPLFFVLHTQLQEWLERKRRAALAGAANVMLGISMQLYKLHKWFWRQRDKLWQAAHRER